MTPLGLSRAELVAALTRYLELVRSVIGSAEAQPGHSIGSRQEAALDDLCFTLDVDIAARGSVSEHSEMSELEARDFQPLLKRLCERVSPLATSVPTPAWIALLEAVENEIGLVLGNVRARAANG